MIKGSIAIQAGDRAPWWVRWVVYLMRTRYRFALPESWAEVPAELIPKVFALLAERPGGRVGLELLRLLLPIRAGLFFRIAALDFTEKLLPYVQWMEHTPALTLPVRRIQHRGVDYHLFEPGLHNMTMREYIAADAAYTELVADSSADRLALFLATVLREGATDEEQVRRRNDIRIPYSRYDIPERAERLATLPIGWQYYVLHVFGHAKHYLYTRYLPPSDKEAKQDAQQHGAEWGDILTDVAETGVFGTLEEVNHTSVIELFAWLAKNRREAMRRKQEELQQQIAANHRKYLA